CGGSPGPGLHRSPACLGRWQLTCEAGLWQCDAPTEPCQVPPRCPEAEFACRTGGRCVPSAWVCDNEDDCGDGSDEFCVPSCCVAWGYRCDGTADCLDHSDEHGCPVPGCAQQEFRCANGRCIPRAHVCDGELDCGFADESDEAGEPLVHCPARLPTPHTGLPPCCAGAILRPGATTPSPGDPVIRSMCCLCPLCVHMELYSSLLQVPSQRSYPAGPRGPKAGFLQPQNRTSTPPPPHTLTEQV
uniref:Uncharacterized protein n=1 Tax=Chelonoidis abingdonii TaxID=106734 RepID=A0A8C0GUG0_CHEAB